MINLNNVRLKAISPALALLPARMTSPQAELMLLAIGLQESRFIHRRQIGGPARSYWQAERGGGMVHGVLRHPLTRDIAVTVCDARGVQPVNEAVYVAIEHDDVLAAAFARLLLWTDPAPLPAVGEVAKAWELYLRTWRPGAHSRGTPQKRAALRRKWSINYAKAMEAMVGK